MKIFGPKSLSLYLYYITRILMILSGLLFLFLMYNLFTSGFTIYENHLRMELPFTDTHLEVLNESNVPLMVMVSFLFYSFFFYNLSKVFKTFGARKLFTQHVQKTLIYFAYLNLIVPFVYTLAHVIIIQDWHLTQLPYALLHFILGIIVFFISALLKQGKQLQLENDLTI